MFTRMGEVKNIRNIIQINSFRPFQDQEEQNCFATADTDKLDRTKLAFHCLVSWIHFGIRCFQILNKPLPLNTIIELVLITV